MELNGWTSVQMLRRYGASARSAEPAAAYDRVMADVPLPESPRGCRSSHPPRRNIRLEARRRAAWPFGALAARRRRAAVPCDTGAWR
jgi:hypothetical protein